MKSIEMAYLNWVIGSNEVSLLGMWVRTRIGGLKGGDYTWIRFYQFTTVSTEKKDGAKTVPFGNRFEKWCPF